MELAIGTKFTLMDKTYIVSDTDCQTCFYCDLNKDKCLAANHRDITSFCSMLQRKDRENIVFKEVIDMPRNRKTTNKEDNNMQYSNTTDTMTINPPHKYESSDYKDIIINIPNGYEVDVENSDLAKGIIKLKRNNITLDDVYEKLGEDNYSQNIVANNVNTSGKLRAIAYLMDIAKYYNGDWKPDWSICNTEIYYICYQAHGYNNGYKVYNTALANAGCIYFKNEADAQAVIDNPNFRDILDTIYKD